MVKNLAASESDMGSIPGSGRSPGEGNGTHSSILAWEIPWTGEPGGLQSAAAAVTAVVSDSVQPNIRQPTRLCRPWDSPGKNTGMGCHFLLHCMKVKSASEVTQSCPTLHEPMDCSLPGSPVYGIFQARALEWVVTAFSDTWR